MGIDTSNFVINISINVANNSFDVAGNGKLEFMAFDSELAHFAEHENKLCPNDWSINY